METDNLITITEAAQALGITRAALYIAIKEQRLPVVHVLGRATIRRADLANYQPRGYNGRPGRAVGGRPKGSPNKAKPEPAST